MVLTIAPTSTGASEGSTWVELTWDAPSDCADAAYVEREVEGLLGDRNTGEPYLRASAHVRKVPSERAGPWHIDLRTDGPEGAGVRTVTAESCRALANATGLILALAIDPARVAARAATKSTPPLSAPQTAPGATQTASLSNVPKGFPPTSDAGQHATVVHAASPLPKQPARDGVVGRLPNVVPGAVGTAAAAFAILDTGTLPVTTPGIGARAALTPLSALRLELGVGVFLDEGIRQPPTRSGTFTLRVLDLSTCLVTRSGRIELGGCFGVELDWISASGLYERTTLHGDVEWPALRGQATGAYFLTSTFALRADAGGGINVVRPEFAASGAEAGLVHQPARITGRGALGLELRF